MSWWRLKSKMKSITHNNWLNFIWFSSNVSRKDQKWYFQDNHEVYCWERLEKRAIWFIAKFKLGLTLCSIVGKILSKTVERYYVVKSSRLEVKHYFVTLLKQHLLPEYQSSGGKKFCVKELRRNVFKWAL